MTAALQTPAITEKFRVLLVDDDVAVLEVTRRILVREGHEVVTCGSGAAALDTLRNGNFDVMVSDIQMPGISGLKLLRAVREYDLDLPVVLVTGNPDITTAANAVEYGAFRYLIKPVPLPELTSVVRRAACVGQMARSKREYVQEFGSGRFQVGDLAGVDARLDRGLARLWMAYQPIVSATTLQIVAHEALMRVEEPSLPNPAAVLEAAERAHRLHDLGRAVRNSVYATCRNADPSWRIFVNLHPADLLDPALYSPDSPFTSLASRVVLEITERASLDDVSGVRERIAELRALGFQIALDDLGAGYAGLTSFTQLEPDFVKLDMALVRDVNQDATKQKIIRSMVQLCEAMGKQTIAEGIETPAERDTTIALGCNLLQGYLFAKPGKAFPRLQTG